MQKLHLFVKDTEVKKKKQKTSKLKTRELHLFSLPSFCSQREQMHPPLSDLDFMGSSYQISEEIWVVLSVPTSPFCPWGCDEDTSSTAKLQHPLEPPMSLQHSFTGLAALPVSCSSCPVWAHHTWGTCMRSVCAAPHSELTISLQPLGWFGDEGWDNWIRTGWTKEGQNQVLISFDIYECVGKH